MLHFWDFFSQNTVFVTPHCPLRCHHCHIWKQNDTNKHVLQTLIDTDTFFFHYPKTQNYHLIGGDPAQSPIITGLIRYLKAHNRTLTLWTTGQELSKIPTDIIDTTILHIPFCTPTAYCDHTGWDGFAMVEANIPILKQHTNLIVSTIAHPETVPHLPDMREWCWHHKLPWIVILYHDAPHTKDSIAHIRHYRKIPGVWVLEQKKAPRTCLHVPTDALQSPWQWGLNTFWDTRKRLLSD